MIKDKFNLISHPSIYFEWNVGVALGVGGIASAGASVLGSSNAASAQEQAANASNARLQQQYDQTRTDLAPYNQVGQNALLTLQNELPSLTAPITMDEATLQNTPGYQFNLTQGEKAVQNSAAARGLGGSGAALKGAATYATGLADSTYQNQFNNANTNTTNAYNRLMGLISTGESAGAQTGAINNQTATAQSNNTIGAGNAAGAASVATGNALGGLANNLTSGYIYNGLYGSGGAGGLTNTSNPLIGYNQITGE